jgi:hypothetical protein
VIIEEIISLTVHEEGEDYVARASAMISTTAPRKSMKFRCRAGILCGTAWGEQENWSNTVERRPSSFRAEIFGEECMNAVLHSGMRNTADTNHRRCAMSNYGWSGYKTLPLILDRTSWCKPPHLR